MNINPAGLALIKEFEGCRLTAYRDAVGVWTIGYGSTGNHVKPGMTINQERAERLLVQDLYRFELAVERATAGVKTTQNQFSAMVSLAYNIGVGAFSHSTMLKMHKRGFTTLAANAFLMWIRAGKKQLKGLMRRRQAERQLYLSGL